MKRIFQHIIFAVTLSVAFFSLHSCREEKLIDEADLAEIYAEMLITDQWINSTPVLRVTADTSKVYEPILKKYGYTSADYLRSIEHYLNDPDNYADIMNATIKILDKKLAQLHMKKEGLDEEKVREQYLQKLAKEINFTQAAIYVDIFNDELYGQADSLAVLWDSLALCYTIRPAKRTEKLPSADTLEVADSIPQPDTLDVLKTLPVLDTIPKLDTTKKVIKPTDIRPQGLKPIGVVKPAQKMKTIDTLARL